MGQGNLPHNTNGGRMFYIGEWDRQKVINHYIEHNDVKKVLVIHSERLFTRYEIPVPHEFIEYSQTIMYKNYYRLLQWIDKYTLIVSDNIMLTRNRYQLEYNCINNYMNQTPHRLVFSYLPFIEEKQDFMILLDMYNKNKYKNEAFTWDYVQEVKTFIKPVHFTFSFIDVPIKEKEQARYEAKKEKLFAEIGLSDPNTIPRNLALLSGDFRMARMIENALLYGAKKFTCRNQRFKKANTSTYKEDELNTIIDFPVKRLELIQLLMATKQTEIEVVTSSLSVDVWQKKDALEWVQRLEDFYATADIS